MEDRPETREETVKRILSNAISVYTGIPQNKIALESKFVEDLGYDSLDSVETEIYLEENLCVDIDDNKYERLQTVQDALEYLITLPTITTCAPPISKYTFKGVLNSENDEGTEYAEVDCDKDIAVLISKFDHKILDTVFPKILENFKNKRVSVTIEIINESTIF